MISNTGRELSSAYLSVFEQTKQISLRMTVESSERCLIIPDIHQNYQYLESVLEREPLDGFTDVVFLGDFCDAKEREYRGPKALKQTLTIVADLIAEYGEKIEILLGNHDVLYYYMQDLGNTNPLDRAIVMDYYGMPDREILSVCSDPAYREFWKRFRIATIKHNHLLTHAGVTLKRWNTARKPEVNISALNRNLGRVNDGEGEIRSFFRAGLTRGGDLPEGGPLWLDWNTEFKDELPLPQVVGHTAGSVWRRTERSFCLDALQSCYAILDSEGVHPQYLEKKEKDSWLF